MRTMIGVLLWLGLGVSTAFARGEIEIHRLSERVLVLTADNPTNNNLTAIATEEGVVVVDTTTSPGLAARLRTIVERELGRDDFVYTINTHHHWDHVFGNQTFGEATVIAHERTPGRIRRSLPAEGHPAPWLATSPVNPRREQLEELDPASDKAQELEDEIDWFLAAHRELAEGFSPTLPALTFNDRLSLDMGDVTLRLYYYGQADTDNSIVVHVPEEGVLVTGDLYWSDGVFSYFGDGLNLEIPRWIEVLDTVLEDANGLRWVVSGHRHIWPGEHLVLLRRYIAELWAAVREAKGAGSGLEETQRRLTVGRFPYLDRLGFDAFLAEEEQQRRNVAAFWRQLQISAADEVERALAEAGPEAAAARFEAVRADPSDGYYLDEDEFNSLGYRLIRAASFDAAVAVLRINVELFPESWNVHDSLGEAYAFAGQPENARESFGRSLELNPDNRNSRQWLQRLDANAAAAATATATARPISESAGSLVLRLGPQQLPNVFTYQVGLGDLDGDGDLDAAFANMRLNESRIWMNDGSGRLVDSGQALTRQGHGVGVGDLDGDGDLDLFITCAGYGEGGISYRKPSRVYLNDGRGLFTDSGQDLGDTELSGNHVTLIDVDLDRDLDAHVVYYGEPDAVYLNDGKARFSRSERVVPEGATFGDLDGDGDLDVFVRNVGSGYESRLRDGEGGLREHWRLASADVAFGHVVLADLDDDGDADAFVTSGIRETASPARVLLNDGAGAFFDSGQRLGLTDGGGLAAGDLDSDGDIDVFLSRKQRTNEIWLNDGDGRFTGLRLEHSDPTTIPSLGDLDGDGDLDLVVGSFGGRAQVWLNGGIDKSESSAPTTRESK